MAKGYVNTEVGDEPVRLGIDIPADLKMKFAIEARKAGRTMTQVVEALVRLWLAGEVKLPEK